MSSSPLPDLLKLPAADRAELAIALWESLSDSDRGQAFELSAEQREDLNHRWNEHVQNPGSAVPWALVRSKLFD
jgi:putative addiction module component (TIGR02574 family)